VCDHCGEPIYDPIMSAFVGDGNSITEPDFTVTEEDTYYYKE